MPACTLVVSASQVRAPGLAAGGMKPRFGRLDDAVIVRDALPGELAEVGEIRVAAQRLYQRAGFRRLPDRDWSPAPGVTLLAYGMDLAADH